MDLDCCYFGVFGWLVVVIVLLLAVNSVGFFAVLIVVLVGVAF